MNIHSNKDISALISLAQDKLINLFEQNKDTPLLFLVSGGSAFSLLENLPLPDEAKNITITVLDERADASLDINNFSQLEKTTFFLQAYKKGATFISTKRNNEETWDEVSIRFEERLRNWREDNPTGLIVATLGMGPDGHTSGIMPFPEDRELFEKLFNKESWIKMYDATGKNPYPIRITTTLTFLKEIDYAIVFITGENKREAYTKFLTKEGDIAETPIRIVKEMKKADIFTDIEL